MDRAEVEQLYRQYGSLVLRRARSILRNEDEAMDVMQEVFVRVIRNIDAFRGDASPTTWLYRITTNLCLNRIRDRKRQRQKLEAEGPPATDSSGGGHGARIDIYRVLEFMPAKAAEPALFHYVDGMSHREIAELLGIPRRTVSNRIKVFDKLAREHFEGRATEVGQ